MLVSSHKFLHDKLQEIYERSQVASSLKNYLPVMAEFAKELLSSPFFEDFQKGVLEALRNNLAPMLRFKEPCYKEVMVARELLVSYEQRIPVISIYLQKFNEIEKSRSLMSWELIEDLATVIKTACVCLTLKNQWVNTDDKQEELLVTKVRTHFILDAPQG